MPKALEPIAAAAVKVRPAATTLVLRDGPAGFEVLMVRRSTHATFMPSSYVFPGGAVDETDGEMQQYCDEPTTKLNRRIGEVVGVGDKAGAFAVAALRECFEECGLWLGAGDQDTALLRELQSGRHGRTHFLELARAAGMCLSTSALHPWSRWVTPFGVAKRFDTVFFVVTAPPGQTPEVDAGETTALEWVTPDSALAASEHGRFQMEFATRRTIESLLPHAWGGVTALLAHAASMSRLPTVHPRLVLDAELQVSGVLMPADAGYDERGYFGSACS